MESFSVGSSGGSLEHPEAGRMKKREWMKWIDFCRGRYQGLSERSFRRFRLGQVIDSDTNLWDSVYNGRLIYKIGTLELCVEMKINMSILSHILGAGLFIRRDSTESEGNEDHFRYRRHGVLGAVLPAVFRAKCATV